MSWETRPLSEIADLCLGKMLDQQKNRGDLMPYLANINVRWGEFDLVDLRQMRVLPGEIDRYGLRYGDIVMCEGGEPGRCAIWKDAAPSMMVQKALHRVRPHSGIDYRFLFYSFLHKGRTGRFAPLFTGSTIMHLPREKLAKLEVTFPDRVTQSRIADILAAYDDLIENNRRRIKLLEEAARLIYREWFVRLRFPGHEQTRIVDGVPEGWRRVALRDVAEVVRGRSYTSAELSDTTGRDFVNLKCFERYGGFRDTGLKRYTGQSKPEQTVGPSDIVMAVTDMTQDRMIVAQAARVPRTVQPGSVFSMDVVKLVPAEGVASAWLYSYLRFSSFSSCVAQFGSGATVVHLSPRLIEQHECIAPPRHVRDEFSARVGLIYAFIDVLGLQCLRSARARDLLLPRLMSGEVEV
ncbi:MAG: restriction endonuclease subunit S [Armatimonadetes bacterium]|nr:restriction endonuclease subunit S [Armatimonadota bacterium]